MAPPISPCTGPDSSPPFCRKPLELGSVFHTFPARRSASIRGDNFVSFTDFCVSLPKRSHRALAETSDWVDSVSSLLALPGLCRLR